MACNPECSESCCNVVADEPAHWMAPEPEEGRRGYWRQFLKCSDGNYIIGHGQTKEQAEIFAKMRRQDRELELNLTPKARLKNLAAGNLGDTDQRVAIRLIIEILLENKSI